MSGRRRTRTVRVALAIGAVIVLGPGAPAGAAPSGTLDTTFSGDGKATVDFTGGDVALAVTVQGDGKALIAGRTGDGRLGIARLLATGALDPSFSGDGRVTTAFRGPVGDRAALRVQADGKLVAAVAFSPSNGMPHRAIGIARYLADGAPDASFGPGGVREVAAGDDAVLHLAFQPDGKILASGAVPLPGGGSGGFVTRLTAGGASDGGYRELQGSGAAGPAASQPDGRVVVTLGGDVLRLRTDLTPDASFGAGGRAPSMSARADLLVQPDDRILGVGEERLSAPDTRLALERRLPDGRPDPSFGVAGRATLDVGAGADRLLDVARQPNGRVVAAGFSGRSLIIARFLADGRPDAGFGAGGVRTIVFAGTGDGSGPTARIALRADGRLVAVTTAGAADRSDLGVTRVWGDLVPSCSGRSPTIASGEALIYGTTGADVIVGSDGPDRIFAGPGNDVVCPGAGADTIHGEPGDDTVVASSAPDGADAVDGGLGTDVMSYAARTAPVAVSLDGLAQDGQDLDRDGFAEEGDDIRPTIETVVGGGGGDWLMAGDGVNRLDGGAGADRLSGGGGDDAVLGAAGDDVLLEGAGPSGRDLLEGGAGTDTVDYTRRTAPLRIDLDGVADDGQAGEADDVRSTAEVLLGGSAADDLAAQGAARTTVRAGGGDDTVTVRDLAADEVDCGPGTADTVVADGADAPLAGCERRPGLPNATVWVDGQSLGGPCDDARGLATVGRPTPVCTLARATALVPAGGVVIVRAGTYPLLTTSRADTRLTTFEALAGERPSLNGITATASASRQRFEGFAIRDITQLYGTHLELVGNDITPHGVVLQGSDNLAADNDVHDLTIAFDPDRRLDSSRCHANWRTKAEGGENPDADGNGVGDIPLTTTGGIAPRCGFAFRVKGARHVIRGNRIARIPADALQAFPTSDLVFEANTVDGVEPTLDPLEHSDGVQLIGTNDRVLIRDNAFRNTRGILSMLYPNSDPAKITQPSHVTIEGNVLYSDRPLLCGDGCMSLSAGADIRVEHNTCAVKPGVPLGSGIRLWRDGSAARIDATVTGNVTGRLRVGFADGLREDGNLVGEYRIDPGVTFSPGTGDILGPSAFVAGDPLLHLAAGSLAIDQALPAPGSALDRECRTRVPGSAAGRSLVDLGANELGGLAGAPCPWSPGGTPPG